MGEPKLLVQKSNGGCPRGKRLTETDQKVLRQIAKEGFQTHKELRSQSIKEVNRSHSWYIMKKLVEMNWLHECRGDGGGIRGWTLSPKAQRNLQGMFDKTWRADHRPPNYKTAFDHDVVLREVKNILCQSKAIIEWIPEHVLKAEVMSRIKYLGPRDRSAKFLTIPDAIFHFQCRSQHFKAALELEMTRKSKKRLFHKMESHIVNPDVGYVFFIVADAKLLKVLWDSYQEARANSVKVKLRSKQNGIYFIELKNIRSHGLAAEFKGLQDTLRFQDFTN